MLSEKYALSRLMRNTQKNANPRFTGLGKGRGLRTPSI